MSAIPAVPPADPAPSGAKLLAWPKVALLETPGKIPGNPS